MRQELQELIDMKEQEFIEYKSLVEKYADLFEKCLWLRPKFNVLISDNFRGVNINYVLRENESFKDVNFYIDVIEDRLGISDPVVDEYIGGKWVHYKYITENDLNIHIFFHYELSKHCKLVPTGDVKPVYKMECV